MTLDDIRTILFSRSLDRLRDKTLAENESVLWEGRPDPVIGMLVLRVLWPIGLVWLILTYMAWQRGWIGEAVVPLGLIGIGITAGPFVKALYDMQTLYVITDRRAIILRTAWGKLGVYSSPFAIMDRKLELLNVGRGAAHLYFRSGVSARLPDSDYTGRFGFRAIGDAENVRAILENVSRNLRGKEK